MNGLTGQADAAWVTENRRQTGRLLEGRVTVVKNPWGVGKSYETVTSHLFELGFEYSPDAAGECPRKALLKVSKPEFWEIAGKNEVQFYRFAREVGVPLPVPDFYGFDIDADARQTALMLEKVEGTFETLVWNKGERPGPPHLERMVSALADLHGAWWGKSVPERYERFPYSRAKVDHLIQEFDFYRLVERFLADANEMFTSRERFAFERFASNFIDRLKDYLDEGRPQTVVHGDTHFWNFLLPMDGDGAPVLLDWSDWDIDTAVHDLVYTIVVRANTDVVVHHEDELIATWRERLAHMGIEYGDDDFWYDYRYSVVRQLLVPIILSQLVPGLSEEVWQEPVRPLMAAIDKHDCWDLLA